MKNIYLLLITLILFSCQDNSGTPEALNSESKLEDSVELEVEPETTPDQEISEAVQENPLTIADFPKVWLMLESFEDYYAVYEYCEAETKSLRITQEGDDWYVSVIYGQDGQKYKIIEFDAYEEERENFQVMYGMFVLENPDYPDMDAEIYEYTWNKDKMFCTFNGFFQGEVMMVSEDNKEHYQIVKEDCDYLHEN